jgi:hypothetical protein
MWEFYGTCTFVGTVRLVEEMGRVGLVRLEGLVGIVGLCVCLTWEARGTKRAWVCWDILD